VGNLFGGSPAGLFKIDPATGNQTLHSSGTFFSQPFAVTLGSGGDYIVADRGFNAVFRVDRVTGSQTLITQGGLLAAPVSITVVPDTCAGQPGSYCTPGTAFSTGQPSFIFAPNGTSQSIMAGTGMSTNFVLAANNLPQQPGIFIGGTTQDSLPFFNGMNGTLCIAVASIDRLGASADTPVAGVSTVVFDLGAMVLTPQGTLAPLGVLPGDAFHFQRWNRDPAAGGGFANFSDAITICFTP
jgi:hypothetical protein